MKYCKKCGSILRDVSPLMMGPAYKCDKCDKNYDRFGHLWNSEEMRNSKCYRTIKERDPQ